MQNSTTRAIRGLSIAVLVLAIFTILATVLLVILLASVAPLVSEVVNETWEHAFTAADLHELEEIGLDKESFVLLLQSTLGVAGILIFLFIACCIVCLIASILGLKNYNKPEKLGLVFGWSIAGAICSFCTAQLISTALLIIVAVLINKVHNEAKLQAAYAQQPIFYTPYGHPQATYAPYGQPQTPYTPYGQQAPSPSTQQAPYTVYTARPESVASPYAQTAVPYGQAYEQPGNDQNNTALNQEESSQNSNP